MNDIIERIFKNWKTTLVGFIIIGGSLTAVFLDKATLTEGGAFIVMGLGFFFLKDKTPTSTAIFLILLLAGCGVQFHLNRSAYHLRMAKAKGATIESDTLFQEVQLITENKVYDTLIKRDILTDTIYINNTRYAVKLKYDTITKNEYVYVECKGDTIIKEVPVLVDTTIKDDKNGISRFQIWVIVIGFFIVMLAILLRR